jgi:regulator of ribonuclease activity B
VNWEQIDTARWDEVWSADLDVLENLSDRGDDCWVPRVVDVGFRGTADALKRLEASAANFGFRVQSNKTDDEGNPWLFLERVQPIDVATMKEFAATYLQIEDAFEVECDGWGCIAHNADGPISNENPA